MSNNEKFGRRYKYTDSEIVQASKNAASVSDVCRALGMPMTSGASHKHISKRLKSIGFAKSNFTQRVRHPARWKSPDQIFVLRKYGESRNQGLRQQMIRNGFKYTCSLCGISEWRGSPLVIEVDHINGNPVDDRRENLRFLCPNCHSQTKTFSCRRRDAESSKRGTVNSVTNHGSGREPHLCDQSLD